MGEDNATWVYQVRGGDMKGIQDPSAIASEVELDKVTGYRDVGKANAKMDEYNRRNNTSHFVSYTDGQAWLNINYTPHTKRDTFNDIVNSSEVISVDDKTGVRITANTKGLGYDTEVKLGDVIVRSDGTIVDDKGDDLDSVKGVSKEELLTGMDSDVSDEPLDEIFDKDEIDEIKKEGKGLSPEDTTIAIEALGELKDADDIETWEVVGSIAGSSDYGKGVGTGKLTSENVINSAISTIENNIKRLRRSQLGEDRDEAERLNKKLQTIKKLVEDDRQKLALEQILNLVEENLLGELEALEYELDHDPRGIFSEQLVHLSDNITMSQNILRDIHTLARHGRVDKKVLYSDPDFVERLRRFAVLVDRANASSKQMQDILIEKIGKKYNWSPEQLKAVQESVDYDTGFLGRWVSPMRVLRDPILQTAYQMVADATYAAHIVTYEKMKDMAAIYEEWEKSGDGDPSVFYEMDENGQPTGYFATELKWGEYYQKETAMYDEIKEILGKKYDGPYIDSELYDALPKEDQKKVMKILSDFRKKNMKRSEGVWIPNPKPNTEFTAKLRSDPQLKKLHDYVMELNMDNKMKMPQSYGDPRYLYMAPQVKKTTAAIMYKKDSGNLMDRMGMMKTKVIDKYVRVAEDDTEYGSSEDASNIILDSEGHAAKVIPVNYTKKLDNQKMLSLDIMSSMALQTNMAANYDEKTAVMADLTVLQKAAAERKVMKGFRKKEATSGASSNTYNALVDFIDANVYGITSGKLTMTIGGKEISVDKIIRGFTGYVRKVNLFMNIPAMISGYVKGGVIDPMVDDFIGQRTSTESSFEAWQILAKNTPAIISEMGKRNKKNHVNALLDRFGVVNSIEEQYNNWDMKNRVARFDSSDFWYGPYSTLDFRVRAKATISYMLNIRYVDGQFMSKNQFEQKYKDDKSKNWKDYKDQSVYNMYETVDGKTMVKEEFKDKLTPNIEKKIAQNIDILAADYTGMVTKLDRTALGRKVMGPAMMMHRNWMVSGLAARWGYDQVDPLTGEKKVGFHRGAARVVGSLTNELYKTIVARGDAKGIVNVWNNISPEEKLALNKTLVDIGFTVMTFLLASMFNRYIDRLEEDEEELTNEDYFYAYMLNRVYMEQSGLSSSNIFQVLDSPIPSKRFMDTLGDIMSIFNPNPLEGGPFKGKTRAEKMMFKLSYLNNIYMLSHFKERDQYFRSLVMGEGW